MPAVLNIRLMFSGMLIDSSDFLAFSLSSPVIRLEIPPELDLFGFRTINLPARLTNVVRAAPFFPRSSLSI